jgi:hypothetical protein
MLTDGLCRGLPRARLGTVPKIDCHVLISDEDRPDRSKADPRKLVHHNPPSYRHLDTYTNSIVLASATFTALHTERDQAAEPRLTQRRTDPVRPDCQHGEDQYTATQQSTGS